MISYIAGPNCKPMEHTLGHHRQRKQCESRKVIQKSTGFSRIQSDSAIQLSRNRALPTRSGQAYMARPIWLRKVLVLGASG